MTVYSCNADFGSMMTCIYEAWAGRRGHNNVKLVVEPIYQPELMTEYIHVDADEVKASKVMAAVRQKISDIAYTWVYYASLSCEQDALDAMYRFLILGFHYGPDITRMLQNPYVMRIMELKRSTSNEATLSREFLRFNSVDNQVYVAHFEPKNNVLLSVASHFQDRMNSEHWIIVDDVRRLAAIHMKNERYYIRELTEGEYERLTATDSIRDYFSNLWKEYFDSISIKERENYVCQRSHMPLWMRKHVTEFN